MVSFTSLTNFFSSFSFFGTNSSLHSNFSQNEAMAKIHAHRGENLCGNGKSDQPGRKDHKIEGGNDDVWFWQQQRSWWIQLVVWIIKLGPIPRHVAFVMDGNRRYARRTLKSACVLDGHQCGFEQLTRVLDWCNLLEIREISVYAFSIENFKRAQEEVQGLMALAEQKLKKLLESRDKLAERKLRIRFFGNRLLLPERIQTLIEQIEAESQDWECTNFLNICMAYTSTDEIARAFEQIRQKVQANKIEEGNIDAQLIHAHMDTRDSFPLDMLVRTSEQRLSDFMLYQIHPGTFLHFVPSILWPEFSFFDLLRALFNFQLSRIKSK